MKNKKKTELFRGNIKISINISQKHIVVGVSCQFLALDFLKMHAKILFKIKQY